MSSFFERLRLAARAHSSQLCVGLDPDPDRIPGGVDGAVRHCLEVVRQTRDLVCCFKPNSAFWEQYGGAGLDALRLIRERIPESVPVLYDAKRADLDHTNRAYARAAFDYLKMDAITLHPYLGSDGLSEFVARSDKGCYVLCRTSNPGASELQDRDSGGEALYLRVARLAATLNHAGNVGLVVGATAPEEVARVRAASTLPFLIPGVGAQGGHLEASVAAAWNGDEASCLVNVSRSVLYAQDPRAAAEGMRQAINKVLERL